MGIPTRGAALPPVPQNVLDFNFTYPAYWVATQGPDRYRRTVYAFRKRSMPDPVLSSFDAPNSDVACALGTLFHFPTVGCPDLALF